jgi:hypothetical protein
MEALTQGAVNGDAVVDLHRRTATCVERQHLDRYHEIRQKKPLVRRLVGILTGTCALYLTLGSVGGVCSEHSGEAGAASASAMIHHRSADRTPVSSTQQPGPCKMPATVPCCVAMTSCGTVVAAAPTVGNLAFSIAAPPVLFYDPNKPLSRIAAPEPPPPKA